MAARDVSSLIKPLKRPKINPKAIGIRRKRSNEFIIEKLFGAKIRKFSPKSDKDDFNKFVFTIEIEFSLISFLYKSDKLN